MDGNDILDCDAIGHTEIDIIVKAFSFIIDGLNKGLGIRQKWGNRSVLKANRQFTIKVENAMCVS